MINTFINRDLEHEILRLTERFPFAYNNIIRIRVIFILSVGLKKSLEDIDYQFSIYYV
jgi:hypothetical protein